MALKLTWSARRQLLYYAVGLVICAVLVWVFYTIFLTSAPSCFDGAQNQNERGVDCGGVCTLVCPADTHALSVLWARSFEVAPGYYTAAALVRNDNITAGAKGVQYAFQLFDSDNSLIIERDGTTNVPPAPSVPIVESTIPTGGRIVARTLFSFITTPVWYSAHAPALRVSNQSLSADGARFSATVANDTLQTLRGVIVAVVLYDSAGAARAASRSVVDIPAKGSAPVVFTWPLGVAGVVRADVSVLPPF